MSSSPDRHRPGAPRPRGRVVRGDPARAIDLRDLTGVVAASAVVDGEALAELRSRAYEEGFAEGRRDGAAAAAAEAERRLTEAVAAQRDETRAVLERLGAEVAGLAAADRLRLEALADDLLATAVALAAEIVGHDVHWSPSAGLDAVRRALGVLGEDAERVVARLHPDDLDALDPAAVLAVAPGRVLELVADPAVGRGGCVLESGACRVDARLPEALERVRAVLGAAS